MTAQASGDPNSSFGAALAVCPDRSLLVGLPRANGGTGEVWSTPQGVPGTVNPTLSPSPSFTQFGAAIACGPGNLKLVGAPGPGTSGVLSTPPTSVQLGSPATLLGTAVAILRGDGGFRYAASAPEGGQLRAWDQAGAAMPLVFPASGVPGLGAALIAVDLDGDLRDDLVATGTTTLELFVQGSGGFTRAVPVTVNTLPLIAPSLAAGAPAATEFGFPWSRSAAPRFNR